MSYAISGREIGPDQPPYIIAELSANHNGSLERALQTIDAAQRCGASAVKLQTYTADTMTIDCDRPDFMVKGGLWDGFKLHDLYKWAQTALFNQSDLIELRTEAGVHQLVPGLTGLAQINGRDELPIPQKVALDAEYLKKNLCGWI